MIFLEKISSLKNEYIKSECVAMDAAILLGTFEHTPPLAKHIIFSPMPGELMLEMQNNYRNTFPKELLTLYQTMNGADFFWGVELFGKNKTRIPYKCLSIYGIPLTCDRRHIEPYNISIEDLNRPKGTPKSWLKFGSYCYPDDTSKRLDLFVDTDNTKVFAVEHGASSCYSSKSWDNIDDCLCDIFDMLKAFYG